LVEGVLIRPEGMDFHLDLISICDLGESLFIFLRNIFGGIGKIEEREISKEMAILMTLTKKEMNVLIIEGLDLV
jgi:hypothetical protein